MSVDSSRRSFLAALAALPFVGALTPEMLAAAEASGLSFGEAKPFDFDMLRKMAKEMADKPYKEPPRPNPEAISKINYDEQGRIKFNYDLALWRTGASPWTHSDVDWVGSIMKDSILKLILASLSLSFAACSNVLDEAAKKETKEAIFYDAQTKINRQEKTCIWCGGSSWNSGNNNRWNFIK